MQEKLYHVQKAIRDYYRDDKPFIIGGLVWSQLKAFDLAGNLTAENFARIADPRMHFGYQPTHFRWRSGISNWISKQSFFYHTDLEGNQFIVKYDNLITWVNYHLRNYEAEIDEMVTYNQYNPQLAHVDKEWIDYLLRNVAKDLGKDNVIYITGESLVADVYTGTKYRFARVPRRLNYLADKAGEAGDAISEYTSSKWNSFKSGVSDFVDEWSEKADEFKSQFEFKDPFDFEKIK